MSFLSEFDRLDPIIAEYPWTDPAAYANMLAQIYYWTSHTGRLLALAAAGVDHFNHPLFPRLLHRAIEEYNHPQLAIHDIKALGLSLDRFPELGATRAFYQMQYYQVEHVDPLAIFGWALMLEELSLRWSARLCETLRRCHGVAAATFMQVHGVDDVDHQDENMRLFQALPEKTQGAVVANFQTSLSLFGVILSEARRAAGGGARG